MKILVINGPNLNMLGKREPDIYGAQSYEQLLKFIKESANELGVEVECYQSNHEGDIIDRIQAAFGEMDGIVINPGGYTHTSVAIPDALKAVSIPTVEVHISDISQRESYRQFSYTSCACIETYKGFGFEGYRMAMRRLVENNK